ncbi:MAG: DUF1015 domain-containing protein [Planctomycetota bacterium]
MPELHAFRGLRYDPGHITSLSDVVAPPYDVIDAGQQNRLYEQHPANVIRLILNRPEPGDASDDDRYVRAAQCLEQWVKRGVLRREPKPALYVYHQGFEHEGVQYTRRGFMGRVRLERFGEGTIHPHEETHPAAKADRLKLIQACRANLSQVFGIYPDPDNVAQDILERAVGEAEPLEATDELGVTHRLWAVTNEKAIVEAAAVMAAKPLFVADGHHRYETACNYRDQLAATRGLDPLDPANFVLMMCVGMSDPGMIVLPTHRLFRGLPALTAAELVEKLGDCFDTEVREPGTTVARDVWETIEREDSQGTMGLFAAADQRWVVARVTASGRQRMAQISADYCDDWQGLGVALLHQLVVDTLLEAKELPEPKYVHLVEEVILELERGDQNGESYPLAALVMPAKLEHIRSISEQGQRMPAKSTYFYPKLLSGLVINPLEE